MTVSPIEVYIRFRPSPKSATQIVVEPNNQNISVINPINQQKLAFSFNGVLQNATQDLVYSTICERSVYHVVAGYNACVFAYGMTSSGKTYSIIGDPSLTYKTRGFVSRALEQLFSHAESQPGVCFEIKMSCVEVENEKLNDLLALERKELSIYETKTNLVIRNLSEIVIHNVAEGLELLFQAEQKRTVGESTLNAVSSRSHVCYIITVKQASRLDESAQQTFSKLFLVDLAGSERKSADAASAFINKSLASLELCINNLTKNLQHIPFRQSKLTHILRDCLGGSSRTTLLACVRADQEFLPDTIQTLRFAQRAVNVKTEASVNLINRIFEYKGDQRGINSQVSTALAEALESQGAAGYLQAKVLRQLDAENKRLKQEILLLSGAAQQYSSEYQLEQLKKALDLWMCDGQKLPDMQNREDFVIALEYCKTRYQAVRSRATNRFSPENRSPVYDVSSKQTSLPPIDTKQIKVTEYSQKSARRNSGKKSARGESKPAEAATQGKLRDTGALAIAVAPDTVEPAATLRYQADSLRGVASVQNGRRQDAANDEDKRFEYFKENEAGASLSQLLHEARARTRAKKEEARAVSKEIQLVNSYLALKQQKLADLSEKFKNEKAYESQNIANFKENQQAALYLEEMKKEAAEVYLLETQLQIKQAAHAELRSQVDELRISEEYQRKQFMLAFEAYCAGLHRKTDQFKEEAGADENELYSKVLARTLGKSRKVAAK